MKGWDLHCHTVFSDGTYSPTELVRIAKKEGLQGIAISDHDTIAGWDEAKKAAIVEDFPVIRGTEITSQHDDKNRHVSVHVLSYLYDCEDEHVLNLYAQMRKRRLERAQLMVEKLSQDFPITWESVLEQVHEGDKTTVGRPHIADALVAAGIYENRSLAFAGAISAKSPYYIPVLSPNVADVITALKNAGGVVVLAHSGATSRNRQLLSDNDIEFFAKECGLDGLEIFHRDNSAEQRARLSTLADRLGLLKTGGSDWHGLGKPNKLGENTTDNETAMEIIHRGRIRLLP
ncbi:PHP domain-containing protein [Alloscardovia theropitheci]|uniref:PHP domain-containing protein n=1 Tax=Alloscardovia theropitheci TaxID=2496842 RepID=A0A4R0QY94_9BIFI|nr:PHP domain-containing protein [Alloscardovia theropitheci]TCD54720.1 PHP domain-containing protein [Alloscardovia theropitheci]